jgi:hypothetical protein
MATGGETETGLILWLLVERMINSLICKESTSAAV